MALKLPRMQRTTPVTDKMGLPSLQFHRDNDAFAGAIETAFNQLADNVAAIAAAQAAATAANAAAAAADAAAATAQSAADGAQAAADGAQAVADSVAAQSNLVSSYPSGVTLDAVDAGTDATISITAHTRNYADGTTVAVGVGTLTARAYSTLYYVYYDDPTRAGGSVSYQTTTSETTAAQTGDRHLVGKVTTPAGGGGPSIGDLVQPPGVGAIV